MRLGKLDAIGGDSFLLGLHIFSVDPKSIESYARAVRDHAKHRELAQRCSALAARGYATDMTWDEYRAECERGIRDVTTAESDGEPVHVMEVMRDVMASTHAVAKLGKGAVTGHGTGLRALDLHLGGLNPGLLYVPGGRPGMGKSAFTTGIVLATKREAPMLAFSIEMPNRENGQRLLASEIGMDLRDLALDQIVSKSRRFKAKHGEIGPIIIDYLQLIRGDKKMPREQQISETTRELKALAKELQCPVVCLSQLNRECEKRPDKRPQIADLRESGAIEQDADVIIFLYRRGYYAAQMAKETKPKTRGKWEPECDIVPGEDDGVTEFIIAKMRGGPTGTVKALFQNTSARFVDIVEERKEPARGGYEY